MTAPGEDSGNVKVSPSFGVELANHQALADLLPEPPFPATTYKTYIHSQYTAVNPLRAFIFGAYNTRHRKNNEALRAQTRQSHFDYYSDRIPNVLKNRINPDGSETVLPLVHFVNAASRIMPALEPVEWKTACQESGYIGWDERANAANVDVILGGGSAVAREEFRLRVLSHPGVKATMEQQGMPISYAVASQLYAASTALGLIESLAALADYSTVGEAGERPQIRELASKVIAHMQASEITTNVDRHSTIYEVAKYLQPRVFALAKTAIKPHLEYATKDLLNSQMIPLTINEILGIMMKNAGTPLAGYNPDAVGARRKDDENGVEKLFALQTSKQHEKATKAQQEHDVAEALSAEISQLGLKASNLDHSWLISRKDLDTYNLADFRRVLVKGIFRPTGEMLLAGVSKPEALQTVSVLHHLELLGNSDNLKDSQDKITLDIQTQTALSDAIQDLSKRIGDQRQEIASSLRARLPEVIDLASTMEMIKNEWPALKVAFKEHWPDGVRAATKIEALLDIA